MALKVLFIDGPIGPAAGKDGPIALRPPIGMNYRIIDAWAWHDDDVAGGVDMVWAYVSHNQNYIAKTSDITAKTAVNIRIPITAIKADGPSTIIGDLIARRNTYPAIVGISVGLATGHSYKIRALVEEFVGPDD